MQTPREQLSLPLSTQGRHRRCTSDTPCASCCRRQRRRWRGTRRRGTATPTGLPRAHFLSPGKRDWQPVLRGLAWAGRPCARSAWLQTACRHQSPTGASHQSPLPAASGRASCKTMCASTREDDACTGHCLIRYCSVICRHRRSTYMLQDSFNRHSQPFLPGASSGIAGRVSAAGLRTSVVVVLDNSERLQALSAVPDAQRVVARGGHHAPRACAWPHRRSHGSGPGGAHLSRAGSHPGLETQSLPCIAWRQAAASRYTMPC